MTVRCERHQPGTGKAKMRKCEIHEKIDNLKLKFRILQFLRYRNNFAVVPSINVSPVLLWKKFDQTNWQNHEKL